MERSVFLGLDIGSTTAKLALVAADGKLLEAQYLRHGAAVRQTLSTMLDQLALKYPGMAVSAAITGSASLGLSEALGLPFVQEVVAASRAIAVLAPQTDVAVELGGEDAKILYLSQGMDLRMNEACAGGTGAFIDQMAALLHTDASGLNELAANYKTLYPIASRCGCSPRPTWSPAQRRGRAGRPRRLHLSGRGRTDHRRAGLREPHPGQGRLPRRAAALPARTPQTLHRHAQAHARRGGAVPERPIYGCARHGPEPCGAARRGTHGPHGARHAGHAGRARPRAGRCRGSGGLPAPAVRQRSRLRAVPRTPQPGRRPAQAAGNRVRPALPRRRPRFDDGQGRACRCRRRCPGFMV